jgi:hypothetical protein
MTDIHETWLARQRARWVRPDAERYVRPDAERYMRPDAARFLRPDRDRFLRPEFQERKDAPGSRHERQSADHFEQLDEATRTQVRLELASLRLELALLRLGERWRKANFNPNQPRVPAGNPDGGQWTSEGGGAGRNDPRVVSDATPDNEWKPGAQFAQRRTPRGPILINGRWVVPTPAQSARLAVAEAQARDAVRRVRQLDPGWRPTSSQFESVEGLIGANRAEAQQAEARIAELAGMGIGPGRYARESIPARGPERDFTAQEHRDINQIFSKYGCHTCGTFDPGTRSGNAILDHQPPITLSPHGGSFRLYGQCAHCSHVQGGHVLHLRGRR